MPGRWRWLQATQTCCASMPMRCGGWPERGGAAVLEAGLPRMLAADPKDLVALWFLGVAAQKAGRPEEARQAWSEMRDQFSEGSPERAAIKQRISQLPVPERPHGHTLLP